MKRTSGVCLLERRAAGRRCLACLLGCYVAVAAAGLAHAGTIELVIDQTDGELFLKNTGGVADTLDGYTIYSSRSALLPAGWTSIAGNYDASGDSSVDSIADWFVLGPPTGGSFSEASLAEGSGSLTPGEVVSLGFSYDITKLGAFYAVLTANGENSFINGELRNLRADYNKDLVVDLNDYLVFQETYGSTMDLRADGNHDNVVNAADYTVWRDSPELVLAPAPSITQPAFIEASPSITTIPEPAAALLLLAALSPMALGRTPTALPRQR
ncbi:hypothetical protein Pla108_37740 [Botrimarina colliarenosi]|uniref:LTD domain-containing protein n=1 Tax=Botrimarina colliarenosi TaxID=2528001 RepID=A0A5C6A2G8_9BACT|nr:hypothetical protein [Botrimarina colliarenosi]TWT94062.1 hypothetical protein Pla108_37740 [Botrimarina colliarenosi]